MALRKLVAGNWKMNGSLAGLTELDAIAGAASDAVDVAICPPATLISAAVSRQPGDTGQDLLGVHALKLHLLLPGETFNLRTRTVGTVGGAR